MVIGELLTLLESPVSFTDDSVTGESFVLIGDLPSAVKFSFCSIISGHFLTAEFIFNRDLTDFNCLSTSIQLPSGMTGMICGCTSMMTFLWTVTGALFSSSDFLPLSVSLMEVLRIRLIFFFCAIWMGFFFRSLDKSESVRKQVKINWNK